MNPETLDIDYEQLQDLPEKRLLCFITANLFGLMNDIDIVNTSAGPATRSGSNGGCLEQCPGREANGF
jgi:hypothetical protein